MLQHGDVYMSNQSINGALNRLFGNGDTLNMLTREFAEYNPWVYLGTLLNGVLMAALALLPPRRHAERGQILDFAIAILCATLASPLVSDHHYGFLLPERRQRQAASSAW